MELEKTKIVIIDDEEDLCFLLSEMLGRQGFEVLSFYNLHDGLKGIEIEKPQWVILDNDLPDGRGWEQASGILNSIPAVNIIMISANPDSHRDYYKTNVFYLIKPLNVTSIVELITKGTIQSKNPS